MPIQCLHPPPSTSNNCPFLLWMLPHEGVKTAFAIFESLERSQGLQGTLNPSTCCQVGPDDELVMMRPTSISEADYQPLIPAQAPAGLGTWSPSDYHACSTARNPGPPIAIRHYDPRVSSRLPVDMWRHSSSLDAHGDTSPMYILPPEYLQDVEGPEVRAQELPSPAD